MNNKSNHTLKRHSKFLSLVLRHAPEKIGITLDSEGWVAIDDLIERANHAGNQFTRALIEQVVRENDKQRFAISDDGDRIRASQGHSVRAVELDLTPIIPPDFLFHGTVDKFIESIHEQGLIRGARNHVHLSADDKTATIVGSRRGKPVILIVRSKAMHDARYEFFRSANGVWLTAAVPSEFIQFPGDSK